MPDHLHGIIGITPVETSRWDVSSSDGPHVFTPDGWDASAFAWQERFYDHIIRDAHDLNRVRDYICKNPSPGESDRNNLEELWSWAMFSLTTHLRSDCEASAPPRARWTSIAWDQIHCRR